MPGYWLSRFVTFLTHSVPCGTSIQCQYSYMVWIVFNAYRCVLLSYDDGAMRVLNLVKAAYDVPATGKPFTGTKQQGLHLYGCSSFPIWSIQVSRLTGMVVYCSADGTVFRSQLTNKAVEKDPSRNRAPHFVCGSLTEDNSAITVNTPLPDMPLPFEMAIYEQYQNQHRCSTPSNGVLSNGISEKP